MKLSGRPLRRAACTDGMRSSMASGSKISCCGRTMPCTSTLKGSMMSSNAHQHKDEDLPYLDRIDELERVTIVRLKGEITRDMIPTIERRIQDNRRMGSKIDKNVLVD